LFGRYEASGVLLLSYSSVSGPAVVDSAYYFSPAVASALLTPPLLSDGLASVYTAGMVDAEACNVTESVLPSVPPPVLPHIV